MIKNDQLYKMLLIYQNLKEKAPSEEALTEKVQELSLEDKGIYILEEYLMDLLETADAYDIPLDMTYKTADSLGPALAALYTKIYKQLEDHEAGIYLAKALAAYLTFLYMNEHRGEIQVTLAADDDNAESKYWAGILSIAACGNGETDFLPASREAIRAGEGLEIKAEPVVLEYLRFTDVDLADFGFDDYLLTIDREE